MALIEWKQEYELGLPELDFEHRDLLEQVSALYAQCAATPQPAIVADCLGRLHARLAAHFALEERTMVEMRNPRFAAHKAEHDRFLEEVTDIVASFDDSAQVVAADIEAFAHRVRDWIVGHITTYDRQLVERGR
jgi:hemerythrin